MLAKKCFLLGIFTLLSMSLAISAQPVHPTTGEPLVIDCLRGTPDAIDGDLSDWNLEAMTPAVLDAVEQLNFGQENWTGPEDCSGEFYLLWDDVNIYIAVVVKDEKLSMNKTGGDIWNADAVEIFFATTDARADHSWSNPTIHYQYGFNANNQKWNWCNMDGPGQSEPDYLQTASSVTADGYICEASIEYGQILSLDFSAGNTIGFHAVLDDTDNSDAELQMTWTGLAAHDQSMGYGHMLLSADSVPEPEPEPIYPGTDGLVAHYAFENDLTDSSGNGLDGTAIGDPTFAAGVEGMALDLNGNDYIDCGGVAEFSFADAMTVSTWVNIRSHTAAWMAIVAKGENAWRLGVNNTTTGIHYAFSGGGRGWQAANTATELAFDEWYHVAATYDTKVGAQVYIDGVVDATNPDLGGIDTNQFSMLIGENPEATGRLFDGMLDEIMLYNRALSEGEILYLAGERPAPVDPGTNGLLAYYPLDGDANDISSNGINGTIFNADTGGLGEGGSVWVDDPERGTVISFNGTASGAYVRAGEIPQMTLTHDFTWSFWAKQKAENTTTNDIILGNRKDENAVDFVPRQFIKFTPTKFEWHMNGNGNDNMEYDDIPADVWLHHVVVKSGDQLTYYRNGIEAGSGTITQPLDFPQPLFFGGDNEGAEGENWNGLMSDVCIYDRALSVGEVRYLAGYRVQAEPVHSYTFEDGTGNDSIGEADGVLMGDASIVDGSLLVDGNGDWMEMPGDVIAINTYSEMTLELWSTQSVDNPFSMTASFGGTWGNGMGKDYIFIATGRGDQMNRGAIANTPDEVNPWEDEVGVSSPELNDGLEHHYVLTITEAELAYYVDGVLIGTAAMGGTTISGVSNDFVYLGKGIYSVDGTMNCSINEFNIYDVALSEKQIAANYAAGPVK